MFNIHVNSHAVGLADFASIWPRHAARNECVYLYVDCRCTGYTKETEKTTQTHSRIRDDQLPYSNVPLTWNRPAYTELNV